MRDLAAAVPTAGEGLITYMRTDGVDISPEALDLIRAQIGREFGAAFVPSSKRVYKYAFPRLAPPCKYCSKCLRCSCSDEWG